MPAAKSGPLPPNAKSAYSRGIAPALARDGADGAHHVRGGDEVGAVGRLDQRHPERARHLLLEHLVRPRRVELHRAAREPRRIEIAQDHVGVGDRRLGAAEVVAERAGRRPRAPRPHLERAAGIDPDQRAAAGADLGEVDRRHAEQVAGAGQEPRPVHDAAAHLVLGSAGHLAVLDDRRLRRRPAHVERDELAEPDAAGERLRADDAGRGAGLDDVDRVRRRGGVGHEPAVGLHDQERRLHARAVEAGPQRGQIAAQRKCATVLHRPARWTEQGQGRLRRR